MLFCSQTKKGAMHIEEGWSRKFLHTGDKALVEWFVGEVFVVLLKVFLGGCDEFDGCELVPAYTRSG